MVAKKESAEKKVSSKKVATSSKKTSIEKTASKKLKAEVKEVKKEIQKEEEKVEKTPAVEVKKPKMFFLKSSTEKKEQNQGKIGVVENGVARATGRRKRAIAKVSCKEKTGKLAISVNDLDYKQFFTKAIHQDVVFSPFALLGIKTGYVVNAEVFGGGKTGQADALKLGLSRCLALLSEEYAQLLRKKSFLTRDARKVEPKKAGLKKARKKEQFSKR